MFLWAPVAMGAGIVTYFTTDLSIPATTIGGTIFILALALWKSISAYYKTGHNIWFLWILTATACALFTVGYGVSQYRTHSLNTPLLEKDISVTIHATIDKLVFLDGGKAKRVVLRDINMIDKDQIDLAKVRLKTYHFKGDDWRNGDRIEVLAKLRPPSGPVMPGGFDFRFKAYYEGLSAIGYTMRDAVLISKGTEKTNHIQQFRTIIGKRLYDAMDAQYAGIAQALLTGERAGIAKDDTEALRSSGLAHLLAISGLHIGLVAGCVFFFVRLFLALIPNMALYYPIKKYAAACAIVIAFTYMVLAGATVPTVRAFIMTSLVLLAVILDRSALNMRLVALAAMIVMVTTPEAVIGPSFVLSFAAVAGLIAFYQGIGREWLVNARAFHPMWRPIYYVAGIIATTVIATLATAPFSVMFFNRFAVYSVIANIAAMPLMAFIVMPFGLLSMLLTPFGLEGHILSVMELGIVKITEVAHAVSNYDGADLHLPSFGTLDTVLISIGFLLLVLWRGHLRLIGLVMCVIAFFIPHVGASIKIMIDEKMKAILVVDGATDELFLIGKMNGYLKRNWLGGEGRNPDIKLPNYSKTNIHPDLGICDDYRCRLNIEGVAVSIIHNPLAIGRGCVESDLIISKIPINYDDCENAYVIDRFSVWRGGAMTIEFSNGGYDIETVK